MRVANALLQIAMIELLSGSGIDSSGVEEIGEYHCTVNLQKFSRSLSKATLALAIVLLTEFSIG